MRYSSISTIGSFTAVNTGSGDYLRINPAQCSGGQAATLRSVVEDRAGLDGPIVFPPLLGSQIITLGGSLEILSSATEAGHMSALDTLLASLLTALDSLRAAPDTLTFGGGTAEVWLYSPLDSSWNEGQMSVTFGLVVEG